MFIWDFAIDLVLGQILDWLYAQTVGLLSEFFSAMGLMGAELFDLPWVQGVAMFFSLFAWALYATGFVVAICEFGIEYQTGRANFKDIAMNIGKGFLAVSLFTTLPVEIYRFSASLQGILSSDLVNIIAPGSGITAGQIALYVIGSMSAPGGGHLLFGLFTLIMMGYCTVKVFFSNLKRGGILLIQIAVGSLYLFSIPRGYTDGFTGWCKQVIGVCLTAFMQNTLLVAGLLVFNDQMLLGLGLCCQPARFPGSPGSSGSKPARKPI